MNIRIVLSVATAAVMAGQLWAQNEAPAKITVRLPAEARLFVDDVLCPQSTNVRTFDTTRVAPGKKFTHVLRAELTDSDKVYVLSRKVTFQAGGTVDVDFGDRSTFVEAARPKESPSGPTLPPGPTPSEPAKTLRVQGDPPRLVSASLDKDGKIACKMVYTEFVPEKYTVQVMGSDGKLYVQERIRQVPVEKETVEVYDPKTTKALGGDGKAIENPKWSNLLSGGVPALLARDGAVPDPFYLKFLSDAALILVPADPQAARTLSSHEMLMATASVDAANEIHLHLPIGNRPGLVDIDVMRGEKIEKVRVRRTGSTDIGLRFDAGKLDAIDGEGKAVATKDLAKLLEKEAPVVIFDGGRTPKASELKFFKKDAVILLVPMSMLHGDGLAVE
jgi:uncharacterized protein (TIGR03000 family)